MALSSFYRRQFQKEMILSRHQPEGPFSFVLVLDNMKPTFNIGKIIRTANALGVREIHLINIPIFNPKPCKGTLKQTKTRSFEKFEDSYKTLLAEGYQFFALATEGSRTLNQCSLPQKSAFVIGHEEFGLSFKPEELDEVHALRIPQFGKVQSLNASIAAGIVCFEYLRQQDPR